METATKAQVTRALHWILPDVLSQLIYEFSRHVPVPFSFSFDRRMFCGNEYDVDGRYGQFNEDLTTLPGLGDLTW